MRHASIIPSACQKQPASATSLNYTASGRSRMSLQRFEINQLHFYALIELYFGAGLPSPTIRSLDTHLIPWNIYMSCGVMSVD